MPAPSYIQPYEVAEYGVQSVPAAVLARASAMMDTLLRRPDGLTWEPDASGWPCYMSRKQPSASVTIAGPILPGTGVVVPVPGLMQGDDLIGEVVVLDRDDAAAVEASAIMSYSAGQIVLAQVQYTHAGPVTLDFGMTLMEERSLPSQRSITRLAETPVVRLLSGAGRYGYGRRDQQMQGYYVDVNLLSMFSTFGGPPAWEYFSVPATSFNGRTGEVWVPSGVLLAYYTDAKFRYVAGWPNDSLPEPIKQGTAMLGLAISAGQFPGNALRLKAGDHEIQRGIATVIDEDIMRMLRPFRAHMLA